MPAPKAKSVAETPKHGYAKIFAAQPVGAGAQLVTGETDLTRGLFGFE